MIHGAQFYFEERRRNGRRVVLVTLMMHVLTLGAFFAIRLPVVREHFKLPDRPIVRFGYEGPERVVETVVLSARSGARAPLLDLGNVVARRGRRSSDGMTPADEIQQEGASRISSAVGMGDDEIVVVARSRAREARVPLVLKSDLVIESLLEPFYPERLQDQGIEGRVALMALVDTTGRVTDISIVGDSGFSEFEESAIEVVKLAKFRPYEPQGHPIEVYALIRYRFTID